MIWDETFADQYQRWSAHMTADDDSGEYVFVGFRARFPVNRLPDPPPAQGVRLEWQAVPEQVRLAFERWAGSRVASAISQPSEFSPGVAARLRLVDGRGMFVKAVGPTPTAEAPAIHRREAPIVSALPSARRLSPARQTQAR